jgi:hypothetical protein
MSRPRLEGPFPFFLVAAQLLRQLMVDHALDRHASPLPTLALYKGTCEHVPQR